MLLHMANNSVYLSIHTRAISMPAKAFFPGDMRRLLQLQYVDDIAGTIVVLLGLVVLLLRGVAWDKPDPYYHLWYERPQEKIARSRKITEQNRNIAKRLEEANKDIVIFWGSQSGTAESFANRLARDFQVRFGLGTLAADLSDFDSETITSIPSTRKAILLLSTYGEGDPSDNTAEFWRWVGALKVSLKDLQYAAFGLGNSNYKYYNRVVDVVTQALDDAGAKSLLPVGRADDSEGTTEEDFLAWKKQLFLVFRDSLGYEEKESTYVPTIAVVEDESIGSTYLGEPVQSRKTSKGGNLNSSVQALPVIASRDICPTSSRPCLQMEINLSTHHAIKYKTGDHLAVWPINPDVEVERLFRVLNRTGKRDIPISIQKLDPSSAVCIPSPSSLIAIFRHYLSICAPVSRDTIQSLVRFAPNQSAKSFLGELGRDKDACARFLTKNLTLGQLLEAAVGHGIAWKDLPLSWLFETLPPLSCRLYSICSSSVVQPRRLAITAAVFNRQAQVDTQGHALGLATNYFFALQKSLIMGDESRSQPQFHDLTYALDGPNQVLQGGKIFAQVRKSKFKLPLASVCPIIMVAAGVGLAPFRGFIQERVRVKGMGLDVGAMKLFFGCRRAEEDFLYREELEGLRDTMKGTFEIRTAFSRHERKADGSKFYVQDRVLERKREICKLLMETTCCFYICGSAKMARGVAKVVGEALKEFNCWDDSQLRDFMERARRYNRWQEDVWG